MFWEDTSLLIMGSMFLTYFCRLSKHTMIQLLPITLSFGVILGALMIGLVSPALADLGRSIAWAGLIALAAACLTQFLLGQVDRIHNSFRR